MMTHDPVITEALKPCPFCGGEAERFTISEDEPSNAGGDVICCTRCQASSSVEFGRKENLVSRWNARTHDERGWDHIDYARDAAMHRANPVVDVEGMVERTKALLAKATPGLMKVKPHRLAQMLRDGALAQRPQADNVNSVDYQADANAIIAALAAIEALNPPVLANAVAAFLAKHDECSPHIDGAFAFMAMHGSEYQGPNYADELTALREALNSQGGA